MTWPSNSRLEAQQEAARLLRELEIDSLPVDPFRIARRLEIELRPLPPNGGGTSGMLLRVGEEYGIGYPTDLDNKGFRNFSVAHEIGHYRLPGHPNSALNNCDRHPSNAYSRDTDPCERQADEFAAELLMPAKLFGTAMKQAGKGLKAIEWLARLCETSLEATAIRYAQVSQHPMAVIRSQGRSIDYAFMSDALMDFPTIDWISKGTSVPTDSITFKLNMSQGECVAPKRDEGISSIQVWFAGQPHRDILEEAVGLGSYGKTLTVLTVIGTPMVQKTQGWQSVVQGR